LDHDHSTVRPSAIARQRCVRSSSSGEVRQDARPESDLARPWAIQPARPGAGCESIRDDLGSRIVGEMRTRRRGRVNWFTNAARGKLASEPITTHRFRDVVDEGQPD
jgi:hypothetical protein